MHWLTIGEAGIKLPSYADTYLNFICYTCTETHYSKPISIENEWKLLSRLQLRIFIHLFDRKFPPQFPKRIRMPRECVGMRMFVGDPVAGKSPIRRPMYRRRSKFQSLKIYCPGAKGAIDQGVGGISLRVNRARGTGSWSTFSAGDCESKELAGGKPLHVA